MAKSTKEAIKPVFRAVFVEGFQAGAKEQEIRDFPNVGMRFKKTADQYFEEWWDASYEKED